MLSACAEKNTVLLFLVECFTACRRENIGVSPAFLIFSSAKRMQNIFYGVKNMKIVPALLTDKKGELAKMIELCAKFTDFVQIDIMDGRFVASRSIRLVDLVNMHNIGIGHEAHLMVTNPLEWADVFAKHGCKRIIYHYEIKTDHLKIIEGIRRKKVEVGIAVNPGTRLDEFSYLVNQVDSVLFMSVVPGFYGAAFIPEVLEKVREFKRRYPKTIAGIDGGIKLDNIKAVRESGVDYICVGSAILKAADPADAYSNLGKA